MCPGIHVSLSGPPWAHAWSSIESFSDPLPHPVTMTPGLHISAPGSMSCWWDRPQCLIYPYSISHFLPASFLNSVVFTSLKKIVHRLKTLVSHRDFSQDFTGEVKEKDQPHTAKKTTLKLFIEQVSLQGSMLLTSSSWLHSPTSAAPQLWT